MIKFKCFLIKTNKHKTLNKIENYIYFPDEILFILNEKIFSKVKHDTWGTINTYIQKNTISIIKIRKGEVKTIHICKGFD